MPLRRWSVSGGLARGHLLILEMLGMCFLVVTHSVAWWVETNSIPKVGALLWEQCARRKAGGPNQFALSAVAAFRLGIPVFVPAQR